MPRAPRPPGLPALLLLLLAIPGGVGHPGLSGGTLPGFPKAHCEAASDRAVHEYGAGTGLLLGTPLDGGAEPCPNGSWDLHLEYAFGGAWLLASDAAFTCWGLPPDHVPGTLVLVQDDGLAGRDVAFRIHADRLNNAPRLPGDADCGDLEWDDAMECVNSCLPTFPPGLDGSYQVLVEGTTGHVLN